MLLSNKNCKEWLEEEFLNFKGKRGLNEQKDDGFTYLKKIS
jgi:hypothetical protein